MLGKKAKVAVKKNSGVLEAEFLRGKTIVDVRVLTARELAVYGWDEIPQGEEAFAFIFDDGTVLIPVDGSRMMPGKFDYHRVEFNG